MSTPVNSLAAAFLRPRSIAMIGATSAVHKAGGRRWRSALAACGGQAIYPIHPSADQLDGIRAYRSLKDLPDGVDLAVVMVPSDFVGSAVSECAAANAKAVVVVSAGFGETGEEGRAAERQMVATLRDRGIRMLGPNSAGVFSAAGGVNTLGWEIPSGNIGLITQSGNIALSFTRYAHARQVGFSSILAVGNSADLTTSELIEVLLLDDQTKVILIYCEGFAPNDGRRLIDVLSRSDIRKPVVILKPGGSEEGRRAVQSHTGSLAGDDIIADSALRAAGVYRAQEIDEAFDVALALSIGKTLRSNAVAILSDGGGHATMVADTAGRLGLTLASFSPSTHEKLKALLPVRSGIGNPVDFAGVAESNPESIPGVLQACLEDPSVSGVIFAGHFGGYHLMAAGSELLSGVKSSESKAAEGIGQLASASSKPVLIHSDHADSHPNTLRPLHGAGVPVYGKLESTARGMAALVQRSTPSDLIEVQARAEIHEDVVHAVLLEDECRRVLSAAGIAVPPSWVVRNCEEARQVMVKAGVPTAMKLLSSRAIHKSDVGGVMLGIATDDEAAEAFTKLESIATQLGEPDPKALVTPMTGKGVECFIGAKIDPQFGPAIFFGAGGVLIEIMKDVNCRLAPMTAEESAEIVDASRISPLLSGFRGGEKVARQALVELIQRVSQFCWDRRDDLIEFDLNPVIVNAHGAHIVDARMVIA
ncbi:acetate--CoA ligase family protein [Bradyrhizobium sp. NC92]|uniref:acetate--CoA ligase family protein n=1 Tax=Bradyrhizobium sp. (strain NC92) TaxID=55395 RepID=UPI0021AA0E7C|nr:acetate--CoA ligase family protein [Bradyrhizobium sp. NC92]UWU67972.1 acetate--CoA ligase family protein [Bradyrhizobium sp. NC92]